jgi:hypothetical protein
MGRRRLPRSEASGQQVERAVFPVYFLQLGDEWQILLPEDRADLGHTDFWERTVSKVVGSHYGIPQSRLANLPYCMRRGRVVGNTVYYGEKPDPELLRALRKTLANAKLVFVHDDHERRLREDAVQFRKLVNRYRPKSTIT